MNGGIHIGIDPGVTTGFAVWNEAEKCFREITSLPIHAAMLQVMQYFVTHKDITVRIEDARQRKWFGNSGREQLQGAGSIKRDCKIWEDYLTDHQIPFVMVAPKNNRTKMNAAAFKAYTKWEGKTNEHSRDAAMLVFGR